MGTEFDLGLVLGGFGLFMFGMKFMGDGLKAYSGNRMRDLIDKYTTNPLMGILIGCAVTFMIQSSSATSVIAIGFVRAGIMKLEQAFGILMGANIGTTVTSFLIGLKVEKYALYICFVGGILLSLANRKKMVYVGQIVMGLGSLFFGLKLMGDALSLLVKTPYFASFTDLTATHPILSFLGGLMMTVVLQSSSLSIGIVQKLYEAGGIALLPAVMFVYASNIGTTITGILASIGGSINSKRSAFMNTLFNVSIVVVFLILLHPYIALINYLTGLFNLSSMMQIAVAHMIFNFVGVLIMLPFIKYLVILIKKLIPGKDDSVSEVKVKEIDRTLSKTHPTLALDVTSNQIALLRDVVIENVHLTEEYFNSGKNNKELKEMILSKENMINDIDRSISNNLRIISKSQLTDEDMFEYTTQAFTIKNYERIGDLALNLLEFYEIVYDEKQFFSEFARKEVTDMYRKFDEMYEVVSEIYFKRDKKLASKIAELENQLDILEANAQKAHFRRIGSDICISTIAGSVYSDILGNLERMGDHCNNIARQCLKLTKVDG